jgi:hypothetical protein
MPLREADVSRTGGRSVWALITPALFSQPPPPRPGEEGEQPRPLITPTLFSPRPPPNRVKRENSQE